VLVAHRPRLRFRDLEGKGRKNLTTAIARELIRRPTERR